MCWATVFMERSPEPAAGSWPIPTLAVISFRRAVWFGCISPSIPQIRTGSSHSECHFPRDFLAELQEPRKMVSDMPKETPEWQGSNQT
jgi:hypothetical protein